MKEIKFEIQDHIYGKIKIETPVILDLMASAPIQRLKKLNQFGIPDEFYHYKNFSRYDHSIGVMSLLKNLGASEEEQVAGLLHDVSHPAFSHVYDWVVGSSNLENSQDEGHNSFIRNSDIADVLTAYGYSVDRITDYHHFGLLERESPDLCADRVDYSLREFGPEVAQDVYKGLAVAEGQIACTNLKTASTFGREFLNLQMNHWGGYDAVARYHIFSSALKRALEIGAIQKEDFLINDDYVVSELLASNDGEILKRLDYLRQKPLPVVSKGLVVIKKFRYIDPPFLNQGKLTRLTEVDHQYKMLLESAREQNKQGVIVPE